MEMDIVKFDLNIHDIDRLAELILSADEEIRGVSGIGDSYGTVKGLIRAGNNFLGHENIYIFSDGDEIYGLMIGYCGKGSGALKTLLTLLLTLRLTEFASYMTLTANLLHGTYTPDIEDDDFYISALTVDDRMRGKGIGTLLLSKALELARENKCKSVLLDVDVGNGNARSLYEKFGFKLSMRDTRGNMDASPPAIQTMELELIYQMV